MLVSCGPSQKEKEEIAILTCNIMGESRNMDASDRLKEINLAREQIGEERYLSMDDGIKEAFKYGLCKELVLNNDYQNKLLEVKNSFTDLPEITITEEEIIIYIDNNNIIFEGKSLEKRELKELFLNKINQNNKPKVIIQSNEKSDTESIIQVMDLARESGILSISIK